MDTRQYIYEIQINGQILNEDSNADLIYTLPNEINFSGEAVLKSINLAGKKDVYTISRDIEFSTIEDGILKQTISIPMGVYTVAQLKNIICAVGSGIQEDLTRPGYLVAEDTSKLLTIRYLNLDAPLITFLLGLNESTNRSGAFISYQLPIDGKFPRQYNFSSTEYSRVKMGFNYQTAFNPSDVNSIPLTNTLFKYFQMDSSAPFNQISDLPSAESYDCNILLSGLTALRIRIEDYESNLLLSNINKLYVQIMIEDRFPAPSPQ